MRRTLLTLAVAAGLSAVAPAPASANHACAEGFEILCYRVCVVEKYGICVGH